MIYSLKNLTKPIDFNQFFSTKSDHIDLEIGVGKGRYLKEIAMHDPKRNFIGIEKSLKWFRMADEKMKKAELNHVGLIHGYFESFIEEHAFAKGCFDRIHIMFPDPWPKKRHHKRRIFHLDNLRHFFDLLKPNGSIWIGTDHAEYYAAITEVFHSDLAKQLFDFKPISEGFPFVSNFQAKYREEGRPMFFAQANKTEMRKA